MKTKMQAADRVFLAAAALLLCAGSAAAMNAQTSAERCGCDQASGVKMYVDNVIHDAQQRGIACEAAKIYTDACISVYCSICDDSASRARCQQMGASYFLNSPGFCQTPQAPAVPLTAGWVR
uniref:hypothetical protein n=1 Tax=Candidatus Electronema sp. TaxID=2698783 RepID=UPI00405778AE